MGSRFRREMLVLREFSRYSASVLRHRVDPFEVEFLEVCVKLNF